MGEGYAPYKDKIKTECVDGKFISSLKSEDEFKAVLTDLGVTKTIHQLKLHQEYEKIKGGHLQESQSAPVLQTAVSTTLPQAGGTAAAGKATRALLENFQVGDRITIAPRALMSKLFQVQGIHLDPMDLDPAVSKIEKAVGVVKKPLYEYDCFINYRVASDSDIAEKLWLYLATKNIKAFLDKKLVYFILLLSPSSFNNNNNNCYDCEMI